MEVAFLGSSSGGNSTLVRSEDSSILIDAGLSAREMERRLKLLGHSPESIDAIILSHEHSDHCRGAGIFARKFAVPVMANPPTFAMSPIGKVDYREFRTLEKFSVGVFSVTAYPVPHNAAEPVCFVISDDRHSLGFATDLGRVTKLVDRVLHDRDLLIIEANHDENMLRRGSYPEFLKRTIASPMGHLSNRSAASATRKLVTNRTQAVALVHLSEENNTPEIAENEVRTALARGLKSTEIRAAERFKVSQPIELR